MFSMLGIMALIECMGGHIAGSIIAAKTLITTVSTVDKTIKTVKKCNTAIKNNK